jgi:hypothetical protein
LLKRVVMKISLQYTGGIADDSEIDFYDVATALVGFQRSLALTTHLVVNGEIITQAPALKNATILAMPPEPGSWKTTAVVVGALATGAYNLGTAKQDTPLGHLVFSLYDFVISRSLGVHVDYQESLGRALEEQARESGGSSKITESKADSLIEKCAPAITDMHRPIVKSETAEEASIVRLVGARKEPIQTPLDAGTYDYISFSAISDESEELVGRVTSYNTNTFKGRVFVKQFGHPVGFELAEEARKVSRVRIIAASLQASAVKQSELGEIRLRALRITSRKGRVKGLLVLSVERVIVTR